MYIFPFLLLMTNMIKIKQMLRRKPDSKWSCKNVNKMKIAI